MLNRRRLSRVSLGLLVCLLCGVSSEAAQPPTVEGHEVPAAGEHPRLIVRGGEEVAALREKAATPWGQKVVDRMQQALRGTEKLAVTGRNREVIKEAGYKAAAYGAVYLLTQESEAAAKARTVALEEVVAYPLKSQLGVMDRSSRLHGLALAYDLCYDAWPPATRKKVRQFLLTESRELLQKAGGIDPDKPDQPEHIAAVAAIGLAEMAVLNDAPDDEASQRIGDCEQAVIRYIDENVDENGFDVHGESPRQAAFACGILPFVLAERQVLGRDWTGRTEVRSALIPMVYQAVPEAGIAVTGEPTAAGDRSGIFAMATPLTPEPRQPGVAWLFDKLGGKEYLGVVRAHQGLYMLTSGLDKIQPQAPDEETWKQGIQSEKTKFSLLRSRWQDRDDLVALLHGRDLRLVGMGASWAWQQGRHAGAWSHNAPAGRHANEFLPQPGIKKTTIYSIRSTDRPVSAEFEDSGDIASFAVRVDGTAKRRTSQVTVEGRENGKKVENKLDIPEAGEFTGQRIVGVDYTGTPGAPGLFVVADELNGIDAAPKMWILHTGPRTEIETEGNTFTIRSRGANLHGTIVYPAEVKIRVSSNPPYTNFLTAETDANRVEVVMTVQQGDAPAVDAGEDGLAGGVQVGKRVITLEGERIQFSK